MQYTTPPNMKYQKEEVWFPLSEDILGWDKDFHALMLNDQVRMIAYEKAIKESVRNGMVVVDIGTGTGILSKWALDAGAKKVYAIEVNKKIVPLAKKLIKKAGYEKRYKIYNNLSFKVKIPEKADIIISELLGNLADNEDMTSILNDARQRFLKSTGIMLPRKIETFLVPVSSITAHQQILEKKCRGISDEYNIDLLLRKLKIEDVFDIYYDVILPNRQVLARAALLQTFNFDSSEQSEYEINITFTINKTRVLTGLKGYFIAQLSNNIILDISDDDIENRKTSDCWKHCYLPIKYPISVKTGDVLELVFSRFYPKKRDSPFKQHYSWKGKVLRKQKVIGEFDHGTHKIGL